MLPNIATKLLEQFRAENQKTCIIPLSYESMKYLHFQVSLGNKIRKFACQKKLTGIS